MAPTSRYGAGSTPRPQTGGHGAPCPVLAPYNPKLGHPIVPCPVLAPYNPKVGCPIAPCPASHNPKLGHPMPPISTQTLHPVGTPGNMGGGALLPGDLGHFGVGFTPKPAPTLVRGHLHTNSLPPSQLDPLEDCGAQPTCFPPKVIPLVYGSWLRCQLDLVPSLAGSHRCWRWL